MTTKIAQFKLIDLVFRFLKLTAIASETNDKLPVANRRLSIGTKKVGS